MAVEIVDKMKPKNNGKFKLLDAKDIELENGDDLQNYLNNLNISGGTGEGIKLDNDIIYYGISDLEEIDASYITSNFIKLKINPDEETLINYDLSNETKKKYLYLATPFILGEPIHGFSTSRFLGNGGLDWRSKRGNNSYRVIFLPNSKGIMQGYILKRSDWSLCNKNFEVYFYFEGKEVNND